MPCMSKLEVKNLSFAYSPEQVAIDDVSFSVDKGKFIVVLGHNGSGKSTLAKLIVGLLDKNSGQIFFDGEEVTRNNIQNLQSKTALVFQNPDNQFIGVTVEDDIAFGLENKCIPHDKMQEEINLFADSVNMLDYLKKEPINLSGGQKQRVAIARGIIKNPEIIIFDDSTSALDLTTEANLHKALRENLADTTVIIIAQRVASAKNCDRIVIIDEGRLVDMGTHDYLINNCPIYQDIYNSQLKRGEENE